MSRTSVALLAGCLFVLAYVVAVITVPDHLPRLHWALEALYWGLAGFLWVFPVRWLMLWSVGRR